MCKTKPNQKRVLAVETFMRSFFLARDIADSEISFETPVNVNEIKIVPSSKYFTNDKGGHMVGSTDPPRFPVQFFCNDVSDPDNTEYVELGSIDYDENVRTDVLCSNNVFATKVIVRGKFRAITVVIYGEPKNPDVKSVQKVQPFTLPNLAPDPSVVGHAILPIRNNFGHFL